MTYCVLADMGLSTQNGGYTSMCNQSRVWFVDGNNDLIRLDEHTLEDAWASPTRKEIVAALKNGQQHNNCQDCWDEEAAGRKSKRLISNEEFADVEATDHPRVIMLKPGNLCNLACRHCNPHTSSRWIQDYFKIESTEKVYSTYLEQFRGAQQSFSPESSSWDILKVWSKDIVHYTLYGAEPLLIQQLWDLLETASQQPNANLVDIRINTNGTIWRDEYYETFSRFRSVDIEISVDGIGAQFEYMRYPAKWENVELNLDRYQQLAKTNPNVTLNVMATVSLLNIYYADDIWNYFDQRGISCGFNVLHRPLHLNMRIAPELTKQAIALKLNNTAAAGLIPQLMMPVNDSLNLLKEFWRVTSGYDQLRHENFADTFSEVYQLLKNTLRTVT
jgi:hypothetical protein